MTIHIEIDANEHVLRISDDLIDHEAIESCARAVAGKEVPTLDEVRRMLAKIAGSMTQAVVKAREDRC